jgi:L-lactate dehydrogenase complex protein LldG
MSTVATFEESLAEAEATSTVVAPDEFADALANAVEPPAVGTRLPFDDASLEETGVALDPSPSEVRAATTGVTGTRLGIASLGTVAVEADGEGSELVALYPERHVVVVRASDLTADLGSAFAWLDEQFDRGHQSVVLATGPSATGDMGALVRGVHGPATEHVVVIRDDE